MVLVGLSWTTGLLRPKRTLGIDYTNTSLAGSCKLYSLLGSLQVRLEGDRTLEL